MGLFDSFRNKNKKVADAAERVRSNLLKSGRITDATITDSETLESGETIVQYYYRVQGASFESSEVLTAEQVKNLIKYAPGANVSVRYDPRRHGSSVLE